jgi:hypothetical protein
MKDIDTNVLKERITQTLSMLNERQRRGFLAIESKSLEYGGISRISGASRQTLTEGVKELNGPHVEEITPEGRIRKADAGKEARVGRAAGDFGITGRTW